MKRYRNCLIVCLLLLLLLLGGCEREVEYDAPKIAALYIIDGEIYTAKWTDTGRMLYRGEEGIFQMPGHKDMRFAHQRFYYTDGQNISVFDPVSEERRILTPLEEGQIRYITENYLLASPGDLRIDLESGEVQALQNMPADGSVLDAVGDGLYYQKREQGELWIYDSAADTNTKLCDFTDETVFGSVVKGEYLYYTGDYGLYRFPLTGEQTKGERVLSAWVKDIELFEGRFLLRVISNKAVAQEGEGRKIHTFYLWNEETNELQEVAEWAAHSEIIVTAIKGGKVICASDWKDRVHVFEFDLP